VGAVTYFVRMVDKQGQAEAVQELLLTNPRRIEQGEQGNLAFGVHRSTDNPNEFWLYETWVDEAAVGGAREWRCLQAVQGGVAGPGASPRVCCSATPCRSRCWGTARWPRPPEATRPDQPETRYIATCS
jgi:quinol monooxygenase YgiN